MYMVYESYTIWKECTPCDRPCQAQQDTDRNLAKELGGGARDQNTPLFLDRNALIFLKIEGANWEEYNSRMQGNLKSAYSQERLRFIPLHEFCPVS